MEQLISRFFEKHFFQGYEHYQKPERVFWWFEQICNLRCNHCDIGHKTVLNKLRPALSLDKKLIVLRKIHSWINKPFSLSFIAGEPFLHKDILAIIKTASDLGIITSVTSNGTLISSVKKVKEIIESKLSFIAISIDAMNEKFHDESRGIVGSWKKATQTVQYILEYRKIMEKSYPRVYINSIIMRGNIQSLIELVKWAQKTGVDGITFQPIATTDFFNGSGVGGEFWFRKSKLWPSYNDVCKLLDTLKQMKSSGFPIKNSDKDFLNFRAYFKDPVEFGKTGKCEGELRSMTITQDGFVKMCPSAHENFGNVLQNNLEQMWNSVEANRARKHIYTCKSQCKILANNKEDFYF